MSASQSLCACWVCATTPQRERERRHDGGWSLNWNIRLRGQMLLNYQMTICCNNFNTTANVIAHIITRMANGMEHKVQIIKRYIILQLSTKFFQKSFSKWKNIRSFVFIKKERTFLKENMYLFYKKIVFSKCKLFYKKNDATFL